LSAIPAIIEGCLNFRDCGFSGAQRSLSEEGRVLFSIQQAQLMLFMLADM
jgi:hypothetical protein